MKKSILCAAIVFAIGLALLSIGALSAHPMAVPLGTLSFPGHDALTFVGLGGMVVNSAALSTMYRAFNTAFTSGFGGVQSQYGKIATTVPSSTSEENYGWLGEFPDLREWIGDRQVKSLAASSYQIVNKDYEASVGVPKNAIQDDRYGMFGKIFEQMGYAAATHPEKLIFNLLKAGASTLCFDGQYFFDTDHPVGNSTASNYDATGGGNPWFLLDTRRPLKPLIFQKRQDYKLTSMLDENDEQVWMRKEFRYGVDARVNVGFGFWQMAFCSLNTLNTTNFDAAVAAMMALKSDEGRPLGINPNLLVVGASNRAAGRALIEAETLASGASNTNFKAVELLVCPWLA